MKKLIILIFLGLTTNLYTQDRWIVFDYNEDTTVVLYYDNETIWYKGSSVVLWIKMVVNPAKYSENYNKDVSTILSQVEVFCGQRKYQEMETIIYFADGTDKRESHKENENMSIVIPDSIQEKYYKRLCK